MSEVSGAGQSAKPSRIISLVPSLTEALYVFGVGERVVGRTRYCTLPPRLVRRAEVVGGTKKVDFEAAMSLRPDLVVSVREENTREDVEKFRDAGVEVFVGEPETVAGAVSMMRELAARTGATDTSSIEQAKLAVGRLCGKRPESPTRVFSPIWKNPYMSPGGDTYVADVIRTCGGVNVFDVRSRYPEVSLDEVWEAQPEVVLLPDEPYEFSAVDVAEFHTMDIPAARTGRIHLVDGKLLTWYGPRMSGSLSQLAALMRRSNM